MIDQDLKLNLMSARQQLSPQKILDLIPYSSFIGAQAKFDGSEVIYWLDRRPSNIGNPSLPAIHGIYAACTVLRQGKNLVNVAATAWQDDASKPIATARCHFLLP